MTVVFAILGKLWAFIRSPLGLKIVLALAVCAAFWGYGEVRYSAGVQHERAVWVKAAAKAEKKAAQTEKKSAAITTRVEVQHAATVERIRTVTQTLIKEVPYAVPSDPARASLSVGFVRLHDAAAVGVPGLSDPAGRPDAAASGVDDAALARTVIPNYEACRINAETVKAWGAWWRAQAELYNNTIGDKPQSSTH
jgi:hypothetical protein